MFDAAGNYQNQWGSPGPGDGQFNVPSGVAVDASGHVYVADSGNDRIQVFDSSGNYQYQWGSSGFGDGQFKQIPDYTNQNCGDMGLLLPLRPRWSDLQ